MESANSSKGSGGSWLGADAKSEPWSWTGLLKSQARAGSQLLQNFECEFQIHQEKVAEIVKFM